MRTLMSGSLLIEPIYRLYIEPKQFLKSNQIIVIYICKNYNIHDNDPFFDSFNYSFWHFPVLSNNKAVDDCENCVKVCVKKDTIKLLFYWLFLCYRNLNFMAMFNVFFKWEQQMCFSAISTKAAIGDVLGNSTKFTGNTCARVSFLRKLQALACNFVK